MISTIKEKIKEANIAYRTGKSIMSDFEYDNLLEQLKESSPEDPTLNEVGYKVDDNSRKVKLPINMASLNKVKNIDEISKWIELKKIDKNEIVVLTPKYDGVSLCVNEKNKYAITRGDGIHGQSSNEHYKLINNHLKNNLPIFTYGEVMMKRPVFLEKYSEIFANPRNLVAGLLNGKEISSYLKDCDYIKYGVVGGNYKSKVEILEFLNENQKIYIPYKVYKLSELTDSLLINLYNEWNKEYEIDGIVIEINDIQKQNELGREKNTENPVYIRAYKNDIFSETAITTIIDIEWSITKTGVIRPIGIIDPVRLDGVTISRVTLNNAAYVRDNEIGVGSIVKVIRSGMVIPKLIEIIEFTGFEMPDIDNIGWNENGVELICLGEETNEQKFKKIVAFFEILECDNISERTILQLWNNGYDTIKKVLEMKVNDFIKLDKFGEVKSEKVYNSIQKCIIGVGKSKLQHASGCFAGLGNKKLVLLEHFTEKPSVEDIIQIEGFAQKSAESFVEGWDKYEEFIRELPIKKIVEKINIVMTNDDLVGRIFVFTGVRSKELEEKLISRGAKIGSGVSGKTTDLIMKEKGSGSSKEEKAIALGINILTIEEAWEI